MTRLFSVDYNCTTHGFVISCFLEKNALRQSINKEKISSFCIILSTEKTMQLCKEIRKMHPFLHKTRKEITEKKQNEKCIRQGCLLWPWKVGLLWGLGRTQEMGKCKNLFDSVKRSKMAVKKLLLFSCFTPGSHPELKSVG